MTITPPHARDGHLALTEAELVAWGERLGRVSMPPLVLALAGDLGAGKTTLVRAICRGYGVTEEITSPTFALVHEYHAPRSPVYHLDLYRLKGPSELEQLGWDEILSARALVIIEWPERAGGDVPVDAVPIALAHLEGDPDRRLLSTGGHIGASAFGGDEA